MFKSVLSVVRDNESAREKRRGKRRKEVEEEGMEGREIKREKGKEWERKGARERCSERDLTRLICVNCHCRALQ